MIEISATKKQHIQSILKETTEHIRAIVGQDVYISYSLCYDGLYLKYAEQLVEEAFIIPLGMPRSSSRKHRDTVARYTLMYICMHYLDMDEYQTAKEFNRDRTTVLHAVKTVNDYIETGYPYFVKNGLPIINQFKKMYDEKATSKDGFSIC